MPPSRPFLIGIAGTSCSGKTDLSCRLAAELRAPVISLNSYYGDLAHLPLEQRERANFDEPASLDHRLLFAHVSELAAGRAIDKPVYDFAQYIRSRAVERVEPAQFVIIEGLFTFYWGELRRLFGLRVFLEVPDDIGFARRADRDVRERGRPPESVLIQYNETVRPMASLYVIPTRRFADLIVSGEEPLDESTATVLAFVNKATGVAGSSG